MLKMEDEKKKVDLSPSPHWKGNEMVVKVPDTDGIIKIPVRALNIIWGNDPRFWQRIHFTKEDAESTGFEEGAELLQVNWIEVTGKLSDNIPVKTLFTAKNYEVYYVVKFRADAFGWHNVPIKFKVRINDNETVEKSVMLEPSGKKSEVWHEILASEFKVEPPCISLVFGMFEIESEWWKGGMVLAGVKIKPKH